MVRIFLALILCFSFSFGDILGNVRSFLDARTYGSQRNMINVLFAKKSKYIDGQTGEVNSLAILRTLKDNGLLNFSFKSAEQLKISFDIAHSPLLAMKIINNTLDRLGYTYYLTDYISRQDKMLSWSILINTQSLLDPVVFSDMLIAQGVFVLDIRKENKFSWKYSMDFQDAKLKTMDIARNRQQNLPKPNRPYWINAHGAKNIYINAHHKDNWFPLVTFYDRDLNVLKEINLSQDKKRLHAKIDKDVTYVKIDDKYLLDNIKRGLVVRLD
ncbi:MAG: hypothetical protein CR967_04440 [Proteobacteria bacterium]|nr:MAG: hypothetical protein CR967_04440 [Pseudomonadota bacterium]